MVDPFLTSLVFVTRAVANPAREETLRCTERSPESIGRILFARWTGRNRRVTWQMQLISGGTPSLQSVHPGRGKNTAANVLERSLRRLEGILLPRWTGRKPKGVATQENGRNSANVLKEARGDWKYPFFGRWTEETEGGTGQLSLFRRHSFSQACTQRRKKTLRINEEARGDGGSFGSWTEETRRERCQPGEGETYSVECTEEARGIEDPLARWTGRTEG
ncbi:hypothetical protein HNY73_011583, partial [Argiope bruennichi]